MNTTPVPRSNQLAAFIDSNWLTASDLKVYNIEECLNNQEHYS